MLVIESPGERDGDGTPGPFLTQTRQKNRKKCLKSPASCLLAKINEIESPLFDEHIFSAALLFCVISNATYA